MKQTVWAFIKELGSGGLVVFFLFSFSLFTSWLRPHNSRHLLFLPALGGVACFGFYQYIGFCQNLRPGIDTDIVASETCAVGAAILGTGCALSILGCILFAYRKNNV
jgi:hypothetical protein